MGLRENELLICILFLLLVEKQKLRKNSHNEEMFVCLSYSIQSNLKK